MSDKTTIAAEWQATVLLAETTPIPPEPRDDVDTASLLERKPHLAEVGTTNLDLETPHGTIPARLYSPTGPAIAGLVWVHGGAFLFGHLDQPEANWPGLELAARGIAVLSVDYHKAVHGTKFDVPSDDVLAAWLWALDHLDLLGGTRENLHFGGASAGGTLSASASLRLGGEPNKLPASLLLVYPLLHSVLPPASEELTGKLLAADMGDTRWDERVHQLALHYVGADSGLDNPVAFPGMTNDLSGQPPVYVLNADHDPLRASGEKYADQLAAVGVDVTVEYIPGSPHAFLDNPHTAEGQDGINRLARWISAHAKHV